MKNVIFMFLFLLIFSCGEGNKQSLTSDENQAILDFSEELKKDPVAVEYFEIVEEYKKNHAENSFDRKKLNEIFKKGEDYCNSSRSNLEYDVEIENILKISCLMNTKRQAFQRKYPQIQKMDNDEKIELIGLMKKPSILNLELVKENADKLVKSISPEARVELNKLIENKPDVNFDLLKENLDLEEEVLKDVSKEFLNNLGQ